MRVSLNEQSRYFPAVKPVSETNETAYEREMSRLIELGYEPMGELRIDTHEEQRFNGGCNMWEILTITRYTREMRRR